MPGYTSDRIQIHISIKQSTDLCLSRLVGRAMSNAQPFTELSITIINDSRFQIGFSAKDIFRIFDANLGIILSGICPVTNFPALETSEYV